MNGMPGAFPGLMSREDPLANEHADQLDSETNRDPLKKELLLNSLHVKRLRTNKLCKECHTTFDKVITCQILILYFIDNSIVKLAVRYALQYCLVNLNSILDDLLMMNEHTSTSNIEEDNARDSLTTFINNLKAKYKTSLFVTLIVVNVMCLVSHYWSSPLSSDKDEYLYGFCFLNIIGQLKLHDNYPLLILDSLLCLQQLLLHSIKFHNKELDSSTQSAKDGYEGDIIVCETDLWPQINTNFLVDYFNLSSFAPNHSSLYGSV